MYIQTFNTAEETNEFMKTLVNSDRNNIHYADGQFVVFYEHTKDGYEEHFVDNMLSGLTSNLFHETIRLAAVEAEIKKMQESSVASEKFDDAMKRKKEAQDNIKLFEAKIEAMNAWKQSNTSSE